MRIFQLVCATFLVAVMTSFTKAETDYNNVGREMVIILQNRHYSKLNFDDVMSERILKDYLDYLDPQRLYFTQSDVDDITRKFSTSLDNYVMGSNALYPATEIFNVFMTKLSQRVSFVRKVLEPKNFTFESDDVVQSDRSESEWPKNKNEMDKLWVLHAKDAVLAVILRNESIRIRADELNKKASTYIDEKLDPYEKVIKRYERILHTYTESDKEDVANYFYSTIASSYDPHSDYYSKRETDEFRSSIANSLVGIGALLSSEDDGTAKVKGVVINGPADKQGQLSLNDRILGVDPLSKGEMVDILYLPLNKVVSLIRGKKNTKVTLKIEPANGAFGETKLITITRGTVELKEQMVNAKIYEYLPTKLNPYSVKLGWLKIPSFYKDFQEDKTSVARDVRAILKRMNVEGVDGVIIDLLGNGGGSLDEVQKITGYFTGAGPVVQIKDSDGDIRVKNSYSKKPIFTKPLVVHVNKTSASASEILAAALQDYRRAVIVGDEYTFGKGTVQTPMEIKRFLKWYQDSSRAGTVKATIQKFYRISGGSTQINGVESDIVIPSLSEVLEIGERYANNALKHDYINPCPYKGIESTRLPLKILKDKSRSRVTHNTDFMYINQDIKINEERISKNAISLNLLKRRNQIKESEERRKSRIIEQKERFEKIIKEDRLSFRVYQLSLEDLNNEKLPLVSNDEEKFMKRVKEELEELDDSPDFPSNLDPKRREALAILYDLVDIVSPKPHPVLVGPVAPLHGISSKN